MAEKIKNMGNEDSFVNTINFDYKRKTMGRELYLEQLKMNMNGGQSPLKYITNLFTGAVKKNPFFADYYK